MLTEITPKLLSLLICTRNRRDLLAQTLKSLSQCRAPNGWAVEVIVVDNGSADGTSQLVASMASALPYRVECVAEPQPGLGRARATGMLACHGELVACTDDDCVVSVEWCEAVVAAFAAHPEIGGLFGRVLPLQEGADSPWLIAVKTSETRATFTFPCWPIAGFGNNMAFRRIALESVGGFSPWFGAGGPLWSAEETELTYRLLRRRWTLSYEPTVQVWHRARTTKTGWASTHRRDARGFGAFTGMHAVRGDLFALKLAVWEWTGMWASWWRGAFQRDAPRRQVGGWYVRGLPLGFLVGAWHGLWRRPTVRAAESLIMRPSASREQASPNVSVVIGTRNRAAILRDALHSVANSADVAPSDYELIVVDNGSSDQTHAVVEGVRRDSACAVIYLYEPRSGVSCAKNAGLAIARGKVVAYTDDDCRVASDWVRTISEILDHDPGLSGFFGRVLPLEGDPTSAAAVSVKISETAQRFQFPCSPFIGPGNNMAFRREVLREVGGFDTALGPGAPLRAAEDFDLGYRLLRAGKTLAYAPRCTVFHRPRMTEADATATEWRNAIGLGASLGKHILHGDLFALKCTYWVLSGLPLSALRAVRRGRSHDLKTRWLFFIGVPCGMFKRLGYMLRFPTARAASHG